MNNSQVQYVVYKDYNIGKTFMIVIRSKCRGCADSRAVLGSKLRLLVGIAKYSKFVFCLMHVRGLF